MPLPDKLKNNDIRRNKIETVQLHHGEYRPDFRHGRANDHGG